MVKKDLMKISIQRLHPSFNLLWLLDLESEQELITKLSTVYLNFFEVKY